MGAVVVARLLGGGRAPVAASTVVVAQNTLAAVAEEAFFRRLCFDALAPFGTWLAIGGSAVLFAAVHVSIYGAWVLPVDLAAGLVLGWVRFAARSWRAAGLTHVLANLLVVI